MVLVYAYSIKNISEHAFQFVGNLVGTLLSDLADAFKRINAPRNSFADERAVHFFNVLNRFILKVDLPKALRGMSIL